VFCGSLLFGDKSEYVFAAPQYRAAANTAMGWKNANLLTELRMENGEWKSMRVGVFLIILHSQFPILNS
jgi:hypothetical protein